MEKDIQQNKDLHFRWMVENISDIIFEIDHQGVIRYLSPTFKDIWGYEREDVIGKNFIELVHPDDQNILTKRFLELGTGVEKPSAYRIKNKAGEFEWVLTKTKPRIENGAFIGAYGTLIHITDQKQAEEALRESEERYRNILENIEDGYFEIDLDGNFTFFNLSMCTILGYLSEEMAGVNYRVVMDHENAEKVFRAFNEVYLTGIPKKGFEWEIIKKSGVRRNVEVSISLIGNPQGKTTGFRGITRDITERKLVEDELNSYRKRLEEQVEERTSELVAINSQLLIKITEQELLEKAFAAEHEKLSAILDGSPVGTFVIDQYRCVTQWNIASVFLTGISKRSVIGKPINLKHLFIGKFQPTLAELILDLSDEEILERYADKGVRKSMTHLEAFETVGSIWVEGREHIIAIQSARLRDASGNVIGAIQCAQDITEQKLFEEIVQASEARYRTIVENINDAIYTHDFEGNIIDVNNNACRMIGYSRGELIGANLAKFDNNWRLPVPKEGHAIFERENIRKDGTNVPVEVSIRIVSHEGKGLAMAFVRDISERKRAENERCHYIKLQGVLEMAGAICHELNQPMQIISGYSEMILMNASGNGSIQMKLDMINKQIHRMGIITRKLMKIKDYKTQDYAGLSRIIDINKSSAEDIE